jgi:sec-independent protein translocase protein TatB
MFPENRLLELMIIGAVALIVVGPKDLPILMRRVGQFVGRMRGMANEFRASFEDLARQSELEELRKEVEAMRADHRNLTQPLTSDYSAPNFTAYEPTPADAPAAQPVMTALKPESAEATPAPAKPKPRAKAKPKTEPAAAKPKTARKPRIKTPPTPEAS